MSISFRLRELRTRTTAALIERALGSPPDRYAVFYQPAWIPIIRIAAASAIGAGIMLLAGRAGEILWTTWTFFRFEEVFRFKFPGRPYFDAAAQAGLFAIVLLYVGPFILRQFKALRSALAVRRSDGVIHIIDAGIVGRRITVLFPSDLAGCTLRENLFVRILNLADLTLSAKDGKEYAVLNLHRAKEAYQLIEDARRE